MEALKWYQMAADQGDTTAQILIGHMYKEGKGVKQSDAEALKWYQLAASQGDKVAQLLVDDQLRLQGNDN